MNDDDAVSSDAILATPADDGATIVFDVPAFVRRGQDVAFMLESLDERCRRGRLGLLDMVHMRLRQWSKLAINPDDWRDAFLTPVAPLWPAASAPPPEWARVAGSRRARRTVARDLVAAIERFNTRWGVFLDRLDLRLVNEAVEDYNKYYVIEKECVLGSARLAALHFEPIPKASAASIRSLLPPLPVPALAP